MDHYPTAAELKAMKATDPAAYRRALDAIAERRGVEPDDRAQTAPTGARTGVDQLVEHLRKAYGLTEGQTSQLGYIRRGAVYACVTLRADMLARLPLRAYRIGTSSRGRVVDIRDPLVRRGMPLTARGMSLSDAGTITEVEGTDVARRLAKPNEDWTGHMLLRMTEMGLGLTGQAHWQLHGRGLRASNPPQGLSWVRHDRVTINRAGKNDQARTIAGWILDDYTTDRAELQRGEMLWMRYPDPEDPDFGVLAPTDVARLGADSYHDAMTSNRDIFRRGLQTAGIVMPPADEDWDAGELGETQMAEVSRDIGRKLSGSDARHRLAVVRHRFAIESLASVSPKDAEFVALMEFAIEDAARVYRVPIEFIGGVRRTYQNMEAAFKGIWMMALEPQAVWLADELTARLLPAFGDEADFVAFDLSDVVSLQEDEAEKWRRAREQIEAGVMLRNEWRAGEGLDDVAWGDAWWAPMALVPVTDAETAAPAPVPAEGPPPEEETTPPAEEEEEPPAPDDDDSAEEMVLDAGPAARTVPAYGSDEHRALMARRDTAQAKHEKAIEAAAVRMLTEWRESVASKLGAGRSAREAGDTAITLASLRAALQIPRWVREFRERMRREFEPVVRVGATDVIADLGVSFEFDVGAAPAVNAMRRQAQSFAVSVTDTVWSEVRDSLAEGIADGDTPRMLQTRIDAAMGDYIRSSAATIARTETHRAYGIGSREAARQTGLTLVKEWVSALDDRVRPDHVDAHGQVVPIDDDFEVGGARGPGPGEMGEPDQDINCRCTVTYSEEARAAMATVPTAAGVER